MAVSPIIRSPRPVPGSQPGRRAAAAVPGARAALGWGAGIVLCALATGAPAAAEGDGSGFYVGIDLGVSMGSIESTRTNTGIGTNCDQWLEPVVVKGVRLPLPLTAGTCEQRDFPAKAVEFEPGAGALAGLAVGYSGRSPFRFEVEYFHRRHGGDRKDLVIPGGPKSAEFSLREEAIRGLRADHLFANVYYDFAGLPGTGLRPFVGAGVGTSRIEVDYEGTSVRRGVDALLALDPPRHPGAANKVSHANARLTDQLWGYQLMIGADYPLRGGRLVTGKLRYGRALEDFEDAGNPWRSLRGHDSTVAPGGAPVHYRIFVPGPSFWALSIGLKFPL